MASRKSVVNKPSLVQSGKSRRPKVKARKGASRPSETPKEIAVFDPDGVEDVFDVLPDDDVLLMGADFLAALAHPSRLKALIALSVSELCVGDIAAVVSLSLSATSTMLKHLRSLGFLATRNVGKQTYYKVVSGMPAEVMALVFAGHPEDDD